MNPLTCSRLNTPYRWLIRGGDLLQPLLLLLFRLWIANVFFKSGLTKIDDWDTTLLLFTEEYHVPLLPPAIAALLATAGELGLSALLALGLGARFAAAGLFILNAVAVISYPGLTEATREFHYYWGMLIATVLAFGPGLLSVDAWLRRWAER
ncbi:MULTISPECIES: DoxX family protein [Chromobacterium]|uniref:DoxX family protein n=1 Tax=Chromobacterium aquaticum TaxID=467180 RepID=A0ABV8ZWI0_9NEIS|nr:MULTISPECIES: DoxX family protein [Chromobacterium]KMN38262.1 membrane protein [Chromobacterium sp. LK1]MCD5360988.1 DoxX family protein [Chromobacterium aquaticum]